MKKLKQPTYSHQAFRDDLIALLRKHAEHLPAQEILALSAHAVGQIIAMQDQKTMTSELALKIVIENIEQGNKEVVQNLDLPIGNA